MVVRIALTAMLASLGCDDGGGTSPYCPNYVQFSSPCGVESATSTCGPNAVDCSQDDCVVGPVSADCTVSVVLGDGTQHDFDVTFGASTDSICKVNVVTSNAPVFTCGGADGGSD
jgi:hypothetical protein